MRIEYQYSDQEKQIIEGQNLTHTIEEIPPPFTGGQMAGVLYQATAQQAFISNGTFQNWGTEYRLSHTAVSGAIFQIELLVNGIVDEDLEHWSFRGKGEEPLTNGNTSNSNYSLKFNGDPAQIYFIGTTPGFKITGLARIDGQPDTGGNSPTTYKFTVYENGTEIYRETRFEVPIIATIVVDYLKFAEERLELGIDYGAVGGMRFNTTILETGNGGQQRNANWWLPLGRWQLGDRTLLESQQDKLAEVTYLKEFHSARKGSLEGFRFKDWSDYQIINQEIGIGDGVETEYQLKKTYYAGSASCERPITKPVEGTVRIFVGYAEQLTGWSIDYTSGLIRFDNPPPISAVIKVTCEFDVPVWFESDAIGWRLEGYQDGEAIYRLESVFVEEGRIPVPKPHKIEPLPDLSNQILDLGIIYDTVETIEYQTSKQKLPSGYVRRDDNYPAPITKINLGDRILDKEELDKLLGFFWCAKGKAQQFRLKIIDNYFDILFNDDQLNLKFEAYNNTDCLFAISLLNLIKTIDFPGLTLQYYFPDNTFVNLTLNQSYLVIAQNTYAWFLDYDYWGDNNQLSTPIPRREILPKDLVFTGLTNSIPDENQNSQWTIEADQSQARLFKSFRNGVYYTNHSPITNPAIVYRFYKSTIKVLDNNNQVVAEDSNYYNSADISPSPYLKGEGEIKFKII